MKTEIMDKKIGGGPRSRIQKVRPRRLRAHSALRELTASTRVHASDLIMPHFITNDAGLDGSGAQEGLDSLERTTPERLVGKIASDVGMGVTSHLLFGVTGRKDPQGSGAWDPEGPVPRAIRLLREELGDRVNLLTDVCLCGYTDLGHCGVFTPDGASVDNDATLPLLARVALVHAEAGADMVCPSDMMDGRVGAIREALEEAGYAQTGILCYSSKFASAYYGPFRVAADSAPAMGDRRSYQLDPRNARDAVRVALLDEAEGADALMVKPALPYLDVIQAIKGATRIPVAAYQVSGEYALTRLGAQQGLFEEAAAVREQLTAIKRAGADWIITYHARDAVQGGWIG